MAVKYFMNGGVDSNWASDTNWSTTASSGPNNTTHAVAGDAVIIDSGSPNCTIAAAAACLTLTCTGYTGTLTYNANLTVSGNVTYGAGMSLAADVITRFLSITPTAGSTLTANGKTHPCQLSLGGASQTHVLADNWVCSGALNPFTTTTLDNSAGSTISAVGLNVQAQMTGTAVVTLTGGTWTGNFNIGNSVTFNGNVTVSGNVKFGVSGTPTLTYTAGTMTTTGSTLEINGDCGLNTGGMTWPTVNYTGGSKTLTMGSLFLATTFNLGGATNTPTFAGSFGFTIGTFQNTVNPSAARTITLTQGNTYTVTTAFSLLGTQAFRWTLASSSATLLTAFNVQAGATQSVSMVDATRIDSSGGQTIHSLNGVLNDVAHPTLNWDTPGTGAQWCFG